MSSDYAEVRKLVGALSSKVAESNPDLLAQAIGSACYGLQRLSSEHPEVRYFPLTSTYILLLKLLESELSC